MTAACHAFSPPDLRLVPQVLMPGETMSSLMDRQAQVWGVSRTDLIRQIFPSSLPGRRDLDARTSCGEMLGRYARLIGQKSNDLEAGIAHYSNHLVFLSYRNSYCPICFFEDAASGYTPYFRMDWARVLLTHCRTHACPLFPWPKIAADGLRRLPHRWFMAQEPRADDEPQFMRDLSLAKMYAYCVRPRSAASMDAWQRVCRFEEWLYQRQVGALRVSEGRVGVDALEQDVLLRAIALTRSARTDKTLTLSGRVLSFEDPRVMTFVVTPGKERANYWLELRSGFRSIAKRRALMYVTSLEFV